MSQSIRVAYLNCHGLDRGKLAYFVSQLENGTFDLVVLAETWHVKLLRDEPCPYLLSTSTNLQHKNPKGRSHGGLAVLARPLEHSLFSCRPSIHYITVTTAASTLSFAYLPPSMGIDTLNTTLTDWPTTDGVIADFNLDFLGHTATAPARRPSLDAWNRFFVARALTLMPCENGDTKLDHVVARPVVVQDVMMHHQANLPFVTDHPMLLFDWAPTRGGRTTTNMNTEEDAHTFNLHYLRPTKPYAPLTAGLLCGAYRHHAPDLSRDLASISSQFAEMVALPQTTDQGAIENILQTGIDLLDERLLSNAQYACAWVLGERSELHPHLAGTRRIDFTDDAAVVQAFAKSKRPATAMVSGDPQLSPMEDSYQRWKSYWRKTECTNLQRLPRGELPRVLKVKQVRKIIAGKKNKASHSDGIHALVAKALSPGSFAHHLTAFFNLCLTYQVTPSRWNEALTVVIPKDATRSTANCRPLSIVPLFRSLFESILKMDLDPYFDTLHPSQTGFRRGANVVTNLHIAHTDPRPVKVLIDFEKAYDSPDFGNLHLSWKRYGLPLWARRLLHRLYTSRMRCKLYVNGQSSPVIHRTQGLFQGTILSPQLFNVYIDDLMKMMNNDESERLIGYADDLLLFAETPGDAQKQMDRLNEWSTEHSMTVSTKKTFALGADTPIFHKDGTEIKRVPVATYLGIPLRSEGLDWKMYYEQVVPACRSLLAHISYTCRSWPLTARVAIFKTFVLPKLEYGGSLFWEHSVKFNFDDKSSSTHEEYATTWELLETFHKHATAILLKQKTFQAQLYNILDWTPLRHRWIQQSVWSKIKNKHPETPTSQRWLVQFQSWLDDIFSTAHNVDMFRLFLRDYFDVAKPKPITIRRQLNAETQTRIVLYRRHLLGGQNNPICFCGAPFKQSTHKMCLPIPHGPLEDLILNQKWSEFEETMSLWWNQLRRN